MTPENLRAIRAIHARIVPAMIAGKGWEEAYRQDVGALLAALDEQAADLAALRIEHEAHAALLTLARRDRDKARAFLTSDGYRSCTSAACNCGGWHKATP